MNVTELAELIAPALDKVVKESVEKEHTDEGIKAWLMAEGNPALSRNRSDCMLKIMEELFPDYMKDYAENKTREGVKLDRDTVERWADDNRDDLRDIVDALDMKETIAEDWIEENPCSAGDTVNSYIDDSGARDLARDLIDAHW